MSEDRRAAQAPKPTEGATPGPTVPDLGATPSSTTQIAAEIVEAQAAALDAEARVVPPVAPSGPAVDAAVPPQRGRGDSSPGGRRRGRMGLRIPDDEVSRPQVPSRAVRSDPPPPSELKPIASAPPASQEMSTGPLKPMRIITINPPAPSPTESRPPPAGPDGRSAPVLQAPPPPRAIASAPPAAASQTSSQPPRAAQTRSASAPPTASSPPAPKPRVVQEDSWTPFQPAVADDAVPVDSQPSVDSGPVSQPRNAYSSEEMIPIDTDAPAHSDSQPESIEPLEEVDDAAPVRPVLSPLPPPPPPVRPLAHAIPPPDDAGGEEDVQFEDEASTPTPSPRVQAHTRPDGIAAQQQQQQQQHVQGGMPSEAEIAAEDLVSVESAPGARLQTPPPVMVPPMRARIASQPPVPPPKQANKPPLVIVPPHVGYVPAAPSEPSGLRRKGRLWWEELFNDDYLRTVEKLSDEQIAREADFIEDSLGIERGGALLDLGCGTGRHAIELARRGYEMVGFDLSLAMLARAGDEAQERSAKLNFVQGDMRDMTFEEQFDGIYCWNTSFGYFEEDKNAQVVERIRRALKLGGLFLLDVVNRDFIMRQSPSLAWFEGDGCVCMDEMNIDFITSRMRVKRTMMLDDGRSREIEYSMRVYSLHELGKILHDHGFKVCEVSGRLGTPGVFFGNESPRTIILAEKR
jgi:SAM-dependent methyltransferase